MNPTFKIVLGAFVLAALVAVVWRIQSPSSICRADCGVAAEVRGAERSRSLWMRPTLIQEEGTRWCDAQQEGAEDESCAAFADFLEKWEEPSIREIGEKDVEAFHEAFNQIPLNLREEEMSWALNLIPDENIMILTGVFVDKSQPIEVLDSILNDILNRDEGVRDAILRNIWKDRSHPCWEDVDWILEATDRNPAKDASGENSV